MRKGKSLVRGDIQTHDLSIVRHELNRFAATTDLAEINFKVRFGFLDFSIDLLIQVN